MARSAHGRTLSVGVSESKGGENGSDRLRGVPRNILMWEGVAGLPHMRERFVLNTSSKGGEKVIPDWDKEKRDEESSFLRPTSREGTHLAGI